jgi:hypothetical protein
MGYKVNALGFEALKELGNGTIGYSNSGITPGCGTPNCPRSLIPQHKTEPDSRMAQVPSTPVATVIALNGAAPLTRADVIRARGNSDGI